MMYLWKEWKEQSRAKGIWFALGISGLTSLLLLVNARGLPTEQGFETFLLSLYDSSVCLIPLFALLIASFSVLQEKEQRTLYLLLTKRESYRRFLWKKSVSIQTIVLLVFLLWHFLLAIPMKLWLPLLPLPFFLFSISFSILLMIFTQLGVLLGSICGTRMQLIGSAIFTWFFLLFLVDLCFLFSLPVVTQENITLFSTLYFLDPLHTLRFFLETSIGLFPLDHLSRMMKKMIWMSPGWFLLFDALIWTIVPFELAVRLRSR